MMLTGAKYLQYSSLQRQKKDETNVI